MQIRLDPAAVGYPGRRAALFDLAALARALRCVLPPLLALGATLGVLCLLADLAARLAGEAGRAGALTGLSEIVLQTQLDRVRTAPRPDLALLGDSSCLMGIHVPSLERALPGLQVESFCSIAVVGPAGFAAMLDRLLDRGAAPGALVLVFHPGRLNQQTGSEDWRAFARRGYVDPVQRRFPQRGLAYLREAWLARLVYRPLPGAYGRFYGDAATFRAHIRNNHGSAVDPHGPRGIASLAEFVAKAPGLPQRAWQVADSYGLAPEFEAGLAPLARSLAGLPRDRIYILLAPVPENVFPPGAAAERAAAGQRIAERLGLPLEAVLETEPTLPSNHFATATHLHAWGSLLFTQTLAQRLRDRLAR